MMRTPRHTVLMVAPLLAVGMLMSPASAAAHQEGSVPEPPAEDPYRPEGDAEVDETADVIEVELGVENDGQQSGGGGSSGRGSRPPRYRWEVERVTIYVEEVDVERVFNCTTADGRSGGVFRYRLVEIATGEVVLTRHRCIPHDDPPPEAPAEPPSIEEILERADIPDPQVTVNPALQGVTGMESWFWAENAQTTVEADVELRGWQVDADLQAVEWRWTVEGETYISAGPGTEQDHAAEHTFDTKGTHQITVEIVWNGTYTLSGFGIVIEQGDLEATTETTIDYPVVEVVSVVDDPESNDS